VVPQKSEPQAMNIFAACQIQPNSVRRGIVVILINRLVIAEIIDRLVQVVRKPIKRVALF
jgi:hypothetical protein